MGVAKTTAMRRRNGADDIGMVQASATLIFSVSD